MITRSLGNLPVFVDFDLSSAAVCPLRAIVEAQGLQEKSVTVQHQ